MSLFGVRKNGVPTFFGTVAATKYVGTANSSAGLSVTATDVRLLGPDGGAYLVEQAGQVFVNAATIAMGSGSPDTFFNRISANRLQIYDGSTTAGTIRLGIPEFAQAASTFAQTATITNGPRAANPVHWLEVTFNNGASSGRIPIW